MIIKIITSLKCFKTEPKSENMNFGKIQLNVNVIMLIILHMLVKPKRLNLRGIQNYYLTGKGVL